MQSKRTLYWEVFLYALQGCQRVPSNLQNQRILSVRPFAIFIQPCKDCCPNSSGPTVLCFFCQQQQVHWEVVFLVVWVGLVQRCRCTYLLGSVFFHTGSAASWCDHTCRGLYSTSWKKQVPVMSVTSLPACLCLLQSVEPNGRPDNADLGSWLLLATVAALLHSLPLVLHAT